MIKPPPSTVSMVLASRFGVSASKSCGADKHHISTGDLHYTTPATSPKKEKNQAKLDVIQTCRMHMPNVLPRTLSESL